MTEQTQPTDAEISACILAAKVKCVHPEAVTTIEIARAVLAKWGTPAGAGEVVAWGIFDSQGFYEAASDQESAERFCAHYNKRKGVDPLKPYTAKPLTTPQSTQEQAGAPRVSPEQWQALFDDQKRLVELANSRADIAESMLKAVQEQAGAVPFNKTQRTNLFNNRDLASEKNMGVKLTLAEWHRIVQYIEAAHGIKGADHV